MAIIIIMVPYGQSYITQQIQLLLIFTIRMVPLQQTVPLQGANTLAFTGTQTNAFSVDGSTLSIDAANDRVGLGTITPDTKLTISTPDNSFGLNHTNGTVNLKTYIGGGVASVGTTTANDLRFTTNNTQNDYYSSRRCRYRYRHTRH